VNNILVAFCNAVLHYGAMQQELNVLVLQGGGALGAYQAGAFDALCTNATEPDWVAGISIGAINAALIAGNKPEHRLQRLKEFWHRLSSGLQGPLLLPSQQGRTAFNEMSSWLTMLYGIPGFFSPRTVSPVFASPGSETAISYYDTAPLRATLAELVDFDLLNSGKMRVSVGAVNVMTGNFRYFDSSKERIGPEHIMASGALPPGFPPVQIGHEYFWDGGLVSNTPLQYVIEETKGQKDLCIFQVDLFSAKGALPRTIMEVAEREKEIRFSSRTRMVTDAVQVQQDLRTLIRTLLEKLTVELRNGMEAKALEDVARSNGITVMHIINRASEFDTQSKDYEFSRLSIDEHWANGLTDTKKSLDSHHWRNRAIPAKGMVTFDHGKIVHNENP
jgi:NTE family protein